MVVTVNIIYRNTIIYISACISCRTTAVTAVIYSNFTCCKRIFYIAYITLTANTARIFWFCGYITETYTRINYSFQNRIGIYFSAVRQSKVFTGTNYRLKADTSDYTTCRFGSVYGTVIYTIFHKCRIGIFITDKSWQWNIRTLQITYCSFFIICFRRFSRCEQHIL